MVRGHKPHWVRESAQLGSEPSMAKQVKALQLLSHIIKHEGQCMGPKSSLQIVHSLPSHAHPHNPTPPLYFQRRRHRKEHWWMNRMVDGPCNHGVPLGGLVAACEAVVTWQSRARCRPYASYTASLSQAEFPLLFPLLQMVSCFDCFTRRASPNHRAWHCLQTSHLPTSVYQIQGVFFGAYRLTGALFSSREGHPTVI